MKTHPSDGILSISNPTKKTLLQITNQEQVCKIYQCEGKSTAQTQHL